MPSAALHCCWEWCLRATLAFTPGAQIQLVAEPSRSAGDVVHCDSHASHDAVSSVGQFHWTLVAAPAGHGGPLQESPQALRRTRIHDLPKCILRVYRCVGLAGLSNIQWRLETLAAGEESYAGRPPDGGEGFRWAPRGLSRKQNCEYRYGSVRKLVLLPLHQRESSGNL